MKLYKLTDQKFQSYGGCQWGAGVEHVTDGKGEMCGPGFIHAYTDLLLAVLLNAIHSNFDRPVGWEADGDVAKTDRGLKVGCTRLKTLRQIPLPAVSTDQRVMFAILCAEQVTSDKDWLSWAAAWKSGQDRSMSAARSAPAPPPPWSAAAWSAAAAAAWSAAASAEAAAESAAEAAWSAEIDLVAIAHKAQDTEPPGTTLGDTEPHDAA